MIKSHRCAATVSALCLLLSGCGTMSPAPDTEMRMTRIQDYKQTVQQIRQQEPVTDALTLSEAIARAIKYNLDDRVKQMEMVVAQQHLSLARVGYLPEVVAMAGYSKRSNEAGSISRSLATGNVSLEYSTSQERSHTLSSLRASWDVLDFGLNYYNVQQATDRIAIAKEHRRKVLQNIIQDVQEAYWRTYIAQQISGPVDRLFEESGVALQRFKKLVDRGQIDPKEGLTKQREILQLRNTIHSLRAKLAQGPIHLAALTNLPAGTGINLELEAIENTVLPELHLNPAKLEELALLNRPELRVEDSKKKISTAEVRKSILGMFPHLEFWGQVTHDTNDYLYNSSWSEAGVQVSWRLMEGAQNAKRYCTYKAEEQLADARQNSLSMAIISQVHLALNQYSVAMNKYQDAATLKAISTKIADMVNRDLRVGEASFDKVYANLQATVTNMESMLAYADVRNAIMRLYNTLGLDPLYEVVDQNYPVADIAKRVDAYFAKAIKTIDAKSM